MPTEYQKELNRLRGDQLCNGFEVLLVRAVTPAEETAIRGLSVHKAVSDVMLRLFERHGHRQLKGEIA